MANRSDRAARGIRLLSIVLAFVFSLPWAGYGVYLDRAAFARWSPVAEYDLKLDSIAAVALPYFRAALVFFFVVLVLGQTVIWIVRGFKDDPEPDPKHED